MKTFSKLAVATLVLLAGCRTQTEHGRCIGLNQKPDSTLVYEYSARNIVVGVIFAELVVPPIMVALNQLRCPVDVATR